MAKTTTAQQTNDTRFFLTILLAVLVLGLYIVYTNQTAVETARPTPQPPKQMTVSLSELSDSKESGTAVLREENGKVTVTLDLKEVPKGVKQPAHIHIGKCPGVGTVAYPLVPPVDGASQTTFDVSLDYLKSKLPLAINVHKSEKEAKTYVACGEITF